MTRSRFLVTPWLTHSMTAVGDLKLCWGAPLGIICSQNVCCGYGICGGLRVEALYSLVAAIVIETAFN